MSNSVTIDKPVVSTPASEWARSTTTEINTTHARIHAKEAEKEADRAAGIWTSEIPGAFPHGDNDDTRTADAVEDAKTYLSNVDIQNLSEAAKTYVTSKEDMQSALSNVLDKTKQNASSKGDLRNAVVSAVDTAKQYVPSTSDVQSALANATGVAKQYLPETMAQRLPGSNDSRGGGQWTMQTLYDAAVDVKFPSDTASTEESDSYTYVEGTPVMTIKRPESDDAGINLDVTNSSNPESLSSSQTDV